MPIRGSQNQKSPSEQEQSVPETRSADKPEKPSGSPSGETRAGLDNIRKNIEEQRKDKQARRTFLKEECTKRRTPESWTKPAEEELDLISKGSITLIESSVDEKFADYLDRFRENGLGDTDNVNFIKQAAKNILISHYRKTGKSLNETSEYATTRLKEKLKYLLDGLKAINADARYGFKKPLDCLHAFSEFTALNFINSGYVNPENLQKALMLEKSDYEFFLKSFQQDLNIKLELVDLSGQETTAAVQKPEQMDIGQMLKDGKIVLKSEVRVPFTGNRAEYLASVKKAVYDQLPDNTDAKARDLIAAFLTEEVNKKGGKEGEIMVISANGEISKTDIAAEEAAKAKTKQEAEAQIKESATESSEGLSGGIGKFIAAIMALLQKLMSSLNGLGARAGLTEEFEGLDEEETREAVKFKELCEKSELNLKTLSLLFKDAEKMKKVLALKKEKGLSWVDYFRKYLSSSETDELKKEQTLESEKMAEMFTTEVREPMA